MIEQIAQILRNAQILQAAGVIGCLWLTKELGAVVGELVSVEEVWYRGLVKSSRLGKQRRSGGRRQGRPLLRRGR